MSPVLHPVGPEPTRVYWARRFAVIAVFLALVALILALVGHATDDEQQVSAVPAASTPTARVSPTVTATATVTPSASMSASGSSPSMSPRPTAKASTRPTAATRPTSTAKATSSTKSKPSARPTAKAAVPPCLPAEVRTTLTGKKVLEPGEANTFELSMINGAAVACRMSIGAPTFELKIYSGRDRIWSSDDCSTAMKRISTIVASEKSVGWTMTWNGRRSAQDCKNGAEIPRAGTYFATAQLTGAKPVQLRMILR